ncbi:MAG: T9SS type A sorting domain-containing protein [Bergeyella sp.]|nr:T9SS type A sorting domain-containing protein [Bergeyella sp.]
MRKILFSALLFGVYCLNAQQGDVLTYVGDEALVTVKSNTLVYSGGGWKNDGKGVVNNSGNIMIVGDGTQKFDVSSKSSFNLLFNESDSKKEDYGQLYVSGIPQSNISGVVNKEYMADWNVGETALQQMAFPFHNLSLDNLDSALGSYLNKTNNSLGSRGGRVYPNSIFRWNNAKARYDQLVAGNASASIGNPTDYFIVPRRNASGAVVWDAAKDKKIFSGTPVSDVSGKTTVTLEVALPEINFGNKGANRNWYRERYSSYIYDPFEDSSVWSASYGRNLSQFGNPFLTNMDLTNIPSGSLDGKDASGISIRDIVGIAYTAGDAGNFSIKGGTTVNNEGMVIAKTNNSGIFQVGDIKNTLVMKPLSAVMIKFSTDQSANPQKLNLNNTRRFAKTARTGTDYSVTASRSASAEIANDLNMRSVPVDRLVKQLAVILKDKSGRVMGRTYYAVAPNSVTGRKYGTPSLQSEAVEGAAIYTLEESIDGGADKDFSNKLYINEANEISFKGKELPLVVAGDNSQYTLDFELYEGGVEVKNGRSDLPSGESFYLRKGNTITKLTSGKTMPISSGNYGLYYGAPGTRAFDIKEKALDSRSAVTVILKKGKDWVISFSKDWKSADVEVYSATGQLVYSENGINTGSLYTIPMESTTRGLFLVKTTSEKGDIVTKKMIK